MPREMDETEETETITPPGNEPLIVSADDAEVEEEDQQPAPKEGRDKQGRWTEKKTERGEARKRLKDDHAELQSRYTAMETKLNELEAGSRAERAAFLQAISARGAAPGQQQQSAQSAGVAEVDAQLVDLAQQIKNELQLLARDNTRSEDNYYKLLDKRMELVADKRALSKGWGSQPAPVSGVDPSKAARIVHLEQEFPWIHTNDKASKAVGEYRRALLASGRPDNIQTDMEACAHIARIFQLGTTPRPTERTRQAFGAPPTGPRQGQETREIKLDRRVTEGSGLNEQQIARALFPK